MCGLGEEKKEVLPSGNSRDDPPEPSGRCLARKSEIRASLFSDLVFSSLSINMSEVGLALVPGRIKLTEPNGNSLLSTKAHSRA